MEDKEFYLYIDGRRIKVSEEVYREFYRGERKERYFMEDLKNRKVVIDSKTGMVTICPGREDSYERLIDRNIQFEAEEEPMEDWVILSVILKGALRNLSKEEQNLIYELYFLDKTEREVGEALKVSQAAIHKRKKRILKRLRKFFE